MTFYVISFKGVICKFILMPWKTLIFTWPANELLPWPRQGTGSEDISSGRSEKLERVQNCPFVWKISIGTFHRSWRLLKETNKGWLLVNRSIHFVTATNLSWNCTLMVTIPMTPLIRKKGILCQSTSGFWSESMTDFFYGHFETRWCLPCLIKIIWLRKEDIWSKNYS